MPHLPLTENENDLHLSKTGHSERMERISVHEAKAHFSELLRRVEAGETVVVTKHDRPVVEMRPITPKHTGRRLGAFEGEFKIPDDAFAPLTEEELKDWYGE